MKEYTEKDLEEMDDEALEVVILDKRYSYEIRKLALEFRVNSEARHWTTM